MKVKNMNMFYLSAMAAIVGAVGYQYFVKQVPDTINPIISVMGMYVAVLVISIFLLPFFPGEGGLQAHFKQLNWIQIALAVSVLLIEVGFLLMYRYGWNLSTANVVTGVFVNSILVGVGIAALKETVSVTNLIGIVLSIIGVALISIRP
jgi:drug/metabolite transporter (DMT)-like permease